MKGAGVSGLGRSGRGTGIPDRVRLVTAGTVVEVLDSTRRQLPALTRSAGLGATTLTPPQGVPDVVVDVEAETSPFNTAGHQPVTRGVTTGDGRVVLRSVGGSGFDQAWRVEGDRLEVHARWSPGVLERGASAVRNRHDALRAQVLLHYPALWWAGTRGLAPLHVSVLELDDVVVLLAGPGGVGKSTLVSGALADGATASCDNVAVSDGLYAYGLREALRLTATEGTTREGRGTTHGRRQLPWSSQVPRLRPDLVVVVRRGDGPVVRPVDPEVARRTLVAGTYAAGELRRFWPLTAVVGLATGVGPVHPDVEGTARALTDRLPCLELELGAEPGPSLREMLATELAAARSTGAAR